MAILKRLSDLKTSLISEYKKASLKVEKIEHEEPPKSLTSEEINAIKDWLNNISTVLQTSLGVTQYQASHYMCQFIINAIEDGALQMDIASTLYSDYSNNVFDRYPNKKEFIETIGIFNNKILEGFLKRVEDVSPAEKQDTAPVSQEA